MKTIQFRIQLAETFVMAICVARMTQTLMRVVPTVLEIWRVVNCLSVITSLWTLCENDDVMAANEAFGVTTKTFFQAGILALQRHWSKCVDLKRANVEI